MVPLGFFSEDKIICTLHGTLHYVYSTDSSTVFTSCQELS